MSKLGDQTITIKRPGTKTDARNNTVDDWDVATTHDQDDCYVEFGTSREELLNRDGLLIARTAFAPTATDVKYNDHVISDGIEFTIYGEPIFNRSYSRKLDHFEILLQLWEG